MIEQASLRGLWAHTTASFFIAQVHLKSNNLSVLLTRRNVQIFDQFAHRADLLSECLCGHFDLVKFKLMDRLCLLELLIDLCLILRGWLVKSLLSGVILLLLISSNIIISIIIQKFRARCAAKHTVLLRLMLIAILTSNRLSG